MRQIQERPSFNKIILSPPYSNLISLKNTTSILGTYTLEKRSGRYKVFTSLRKTKNGWYNDSGLRNPGINNLKYKENAIYSVALLKVDDWYPMRDVLRRKNISSIEFNISCPNKQVELLNPEIICQANYIFDNVIVKMPHQASFNFIKAYIDFGIETIHISNTKPTKHGALSGKELICQNLETIYKIKSEYPHIKVIGGGGIYDITTLKAYESVGADHFSLSTVLLTPWKANKIVKEYYE